MTSYIHETVWLNETAVCTLEHLAETSGLSTKELLELIDAGSLEPINQDAAGHYLFHMQTIVIARQAKRLRDDFELDTQGTAVAITLLRKISRLEHELLMVKKR